jgi:hypothetical protein
MCVSSNALKKPHFEDLRYPTAVVDDVGHVDVAHATPKSAAHLNVRGEAVLAAIGVKNSFGKVSHGSEAADLKPKAVKTRPVVVNRRQDGDRCSQPGARCRRN